MSQLRTDIGLLTKKFTTTRVDKVNIVGTQGKASMYEDSYFEEEAKYLNIVIMGF